MATTAGKIDIQAGITRIAVGDAGYRFTQGRQQGRPRAENEATITAFLEIVGPNALSLQDSIEIRNE